MSAPGPYVALSEASVADFLAGIQAVADLLGGAAGDWAVREVGDGNLNLVFIVTGPAGGVAAKQALPYVRLVGESWPLPLSRAYYERLALADQAQWAKAYVPRLIHSDDAMALTVMEFLDPHIILRKGLIAGTRYPEMARHLGDFLARTLYHSSDLHLDPAGKRARVAAYLGNNAMCKISEDLIFDEPYFEAPLNHHTPGLDDLARDLRADVPFRVAVQTMKARFLSAPEALLHGDLHTGSVMVTADDTRAIDPEFAFYGPMGFDVGALLANLWMAGFAQPGLEDTAGARADYIGWLFLQAEEVWTTFAAHFAALWRARSAASPGGVLFRLAVDDAAFLDAAISARLVEIWRDALGFAGCKIIRRIFGLAHVADFESIADPARRAACERRAVDFARALLLNRRRFDDVTAVSAFARELAPG